MREYDYEYADFIYYTPGELDKAGGLWPVRAGRCLAKPHYKVGPKRIECFSIHFVREGRLRLEYDGRQVELARGDFFVLFPDRTYYYDMLPAEWPLEMRWLAIDGERVEALLELAGLTELEPFRRGTVSSRLEVAVDRAIDALERVQRLRPSEALDLQAHLYGLLAAMMPDEPTQGLELASWIHECAEYMELHATEGITVHQVAEYAGVHRSYFTQVFTEEMGMPPMKYMQKVRMEKARRLLIDTHASVTEIGLSLGYPNLYTFTRAFKMYFKESPLALRKAEA
ncbi:AraC family transcriptional regulator [Paenibacillus lupini]|uniref:helix-turn-helix transcriptional regulator n=1 Tax=Paenibacillus lupini TaxID=1450204 RepID=UPI001422D656|nr:AraC family transcriptional regulator [Paenibacillus lupini]NIK26174.1 AraC-like DNA-binding protein [Paenibacillus lupini]